MRFHLGGVALRSRLMLGSARYPSAQMLQQAIHASGAQVVTVAIRRQLERSADGLDLCAWLRQCGAHLLPNTAGCHTAQEAITLAQMARELFATPWVKLEVIGDDASLQPDPFALVQAAAALVRDGFEVFPYCTDDLVCCQRLLDVGCRVLMPWGAPIGSGQGLRNPYALRNLRERLPDIPLVIDAGIGSPRDAVYAMELGFDAVLLNTAVAQAQDPVAMARAFRLGVQAGRLAWQAGIMARNDQAVASTPVSAQPLMA